MELIIHDLDDEELEKLKRKIEKKEKNIDKIKESINQNKIIIDEDVSIICDNKKIKNCMGCFECWVKTPGKCKIRDGYENLGKLYSEVEHVTIISECFYGRICFHFLNLKIRKCTILHGAKQNLT